MQLNSNLSETVIQHWQIVKNDISQNVNSFTQSVQQKTTQTTDNTKAALENNWHTVEKITNTTSGVIQKTINTSVHDLLSQYPWFFQILEICTWGINHPVRGVIILLFTIAVIWSIIKAIVKIIETASWSILKIPFILLQKLLKSLWITFSKVGTFGISKIQSNQLNDSKQQRLAEISHRLEVIHNEQKALLQEAAKLMKSDSQNSINNANVEETSV
ncbi:hypothetical protein FJR11_05735 [Anabaena sp. UHCC 0187]|uniref:hypothetical protein n=1 Tax=Anabaena sp. UHCC 0187 TaxID=2590018 RepID=UPI001446F43B|nr:hypothetical protein [Anabaena sp. UHCC 0187]MDP5017425.1 hypothetical protein [Dolichospermum sp.]MTJ12104.1 hypothetical protein [Anabaena sp. UHCC 0187]